MRSGVNKNVARVKKNGLLSPPHQEPKTMSQALYVAIAICIGSPGPQIGSTVNGVAIAACDVGERIEGWPGVPENDCRALLDDMHDKGNIVKFCLQADDEGNLPNFRVEWARP
jgi:hypothetical protein